MGGGPGSGVRGPATHPLRGCGGGSATGRGGWVVAFEREVSEECDTWYPSVRSSDLAQGETPSIVVHGHDHRQITLNILRHGEPGDSFSKLKLGAFDYFSRIATQHQSAKATALCRIESFETAIGVVLEPDATDQDDWRFDLIFSVAEISEGLIFNGSDLMDWTGRLLLGSDGSSEFEGV